MVILNNKGFIRTLEAVIAIILIMSILWYFYQPQPQVQKVTPAPVEQALRFVLQELSVNDTLRSCILQTGQGGCFDPSMNPCVNYQVFPFLQSQKPPSYQVACEICDSAASCVGQLPLTKEVYADSVLIAGSPASKVIRIYFWQQ